MSIEFAPPARHHHLGESATQTACRSAAQSAASNYRIYGNAKDVNAWLATYAPDAEQYTLHGERLAHGHQQLKARILLRFAEPDLHARLLSRIVMGHVVVDA
jgi:hypothetical protein